MSYNLSKVSVVGRLAKDGELRQLQDGKSVCNGRVAANVRLGKKEITNWFSFSLWDKLAEAVGPKLQKGHMVYVDGTLALEEYKTNDGELRKDMVIYVDQIIVLGAGPAKSGEDPMEFPPRERDESPFARGRGR